MADGPFAALEDISKERRGRARSLLLLDILGHNIAVDINTRLLQRADGKSRTLPLSVRRRQVLRGGSLPEPGQRHGNATSRTALTSVSTFTI